MIRVLALNDDNHDTSFVTENGLVFHYARNFIEYLAKPHTSSFAVKGFALVDYEGPAADLEECLVDQLFCFLNDCAKAPDGYDFEKAFNTLWESAGEWWH